MVKPTDGNLLLVEKKRKSSILLAGQEAEKKVLVVFKSSSGKFKKGQRVYLAPGAGVAEIKDGKKVYYVIQEENIVATK